MLLAFKMTADASATSVAIKENWNALDLTLKYVRFGPQCAKLLKYSYFQLKLDQNSLKSGAKSGGAKDFVRQITNKRASSDVKSARMATLGNGIVRVTMGFVPCHLYLPAAG